MKTTIEQGLAGNSNMAETPDTVRKRILSVTPPNADKTTKDNAKDGKGDNCNPKLVQDLKKRVVEAEKSVGSTVRGEGSNMADQNKNLDNTVNATVVSAPPIENKTAEGEPQHINPANTARAKGLPDTSQRVTRSAVRRGRPRHQRGLSVDPPSEKQDSDDDMMQMLQSINSSMANSQIQQARFENNIMASLDTKLSEIKNVYDSNVNTLRADLKSHGKELKILHVKFNDLDVKTVDLEVRIDEMDDEISACRSLTEGSIVTVNEHIGNVETSLAKDIEQICESAEVKINEQHEYQRKLEDRMQDMNKNIETENQKLSQELNELKSKFVELQTLVDDSDSNVNTEARGACSRCSNCSSSNSVFSEGPNISSQTGSIRLNAHRSLIIDGVLENPFENLAALSFRFITDMGISVDPDDIKVAFRLGHPDPTKKRPRPVKLVLKNEIIRDQIFHFKRRLRHSKIFSSFQLSLDQDRDMRVKMGILKRAANNARALGLEVFSQPHQIKIDGIEYDTDHIKEIPNNYLKPDVNPRANVPPPLPPLNIRRLSIYDRARKMSEKAVLVGTGLQKTQWGLLFFSAGCFLSNFFKCSITYQDFDFKSLEQGYQAIMAKTCNRLDIFEAIMATNSPAVAKQKTREMAKSEAWHNMKLRVMQELLFCKFRQNRDLYYKLLNTRPHALFECTLDEYWGTGCRLADQRRETGVAKTSLVSS